MSTLAAGTRTAALFPVSLTIGPLARMLNLEIADDPVYDGLELQWFDDEVHGTGMLAFLSRRGDRRVDYYQQRGLRLDRAGYQIGGGTGSWAETDFAVARLQVAGDGVDAEVEFTDVDGRVVALRVDDRDARRRRRARLLAPVGAGIDRPAALLLVWMTGFDLVHVTSSPPSVRIDGREAAIGRLPGRRLHRRHLIKYAEPLCAVELNRNHDGALAPLGAEQRPELAGGRLTALATEQGGHHARVALDPPLPDVRDVADDGTVEEGRWHVAVDGTRLTGGMWSMSRRADRVAVKLTVDERWRPGSLPWLMRVVTTVMPVFRRWPTTYRWHAIVDLSGAPTMQSRWERTPSDGGRTYRRMTGS